MVTKLQSATKAFYNLKNAIDIIAESVEETSDGFAQLGSYLNQMRYKKHIEEERIFYLKEIQKYTGYRITSFEDIVNL